MTWRAGALVLLLVLSTVGGYAAAAALGRGSMTGDTAAPLPASPSLPVDPVPEPLPDPTDPPLANGLEYHREVVSSREPVSVSVPDGWRRVTNRAGEGKWKPRGYPANTYVLRVNRVAGLHQTIPEILDQRIDRLSANEGFELLNRTKDSIEVTYLFFGYRRYGQLRMVDVTDSGEAEVEVSMTGRERDRVGARDVFAQAAYGIRLVDPLQSTSTPENSPSPSPSTSATP